MASSVALHRGLQDCLANWSSSSRLNPVCSRAPSAYPRQPNYLPRSVASDLHMQKLNKPASFSPELRSSHLISEDPNHGRFQIEPASVRSVQIRPFQTPPIWNRIKSRHATCRDLSSASQFSAGARYMLQAAKVTPIHMVRRPTTATQQAQHHPFKSRLLWSSQAFKQRSLAGTHAVESTPLSAFPMSTRMGYRKRRRLSVITAAKWWKRWSRRQDSDLHKDRPAGLPLTMKGIEPLPPEELEARLKCDVETEICKKPLYSFTGECKRCLGTGLVSFYRKNGKEVISSCITCQGVGYVQRITAREEAAATFEDLDKPKR